MKTAHHKAQTSQPDVKLLENRRTGKKTSKPRTKSTLDAALKMYAEFNRDKPRTLRGMESSRVGTRVGGSKGNSADDSGNQNLPRPKLSRLARLAQSTQSTQFTSHISRKVSICPIKRSVASIEMNVPTGETSVSTFRPDDDCINDRYRAIKANSQPQPPRAQRVKVATVATEQKSPVPVSRVGQHKVQAHRITGIDFSVSVIGKNLNSRNFITM